MTTTNVADFVSVDLDEGGNGARWTVNLWKQDGDSIPLHRGLTRDKADAMAGAIRIALRTWDGWQ